MNAPPAHGHRRAALGAAATYMGLALLLQRPLLGGIRDHVYHQAIPGNDCLLHAWTLAWDQHALASDPLRLCEANIFYPYAHTLLYSDHLVGLAALLAPLRLLTDNGILIHNLATIAAPALDALALYALAYDLTGVPAAAFAGGLLYGFVPTRLVVDRCQIQMLAAWWLPLVFLFARRAVAANAAGPAMLAGLALALQGLTGIYLTAFLLPFLALAHADWLRRFPLRRHARGWAALLASEVVAALVLLPFALAYRAVQHDLGVSRSIVVNALLSLPPGALAQYVPAVLAVLASLGAIARGLPARLRAERPLLIAMVVGAVIVAFGPAIVLPGGLGEVRGAYTLLLALPGYDALRTPGRFIHLALLAAAVLAAGGVAALSRLPRGARAAVAAILLAFVAESWPPELRTLPAPPPRHRNPVYVWLAAQPRDFRFVELPIDDYAQAASAYQYATTAHWRETPIGNMGIVPPLYPWLVRALRRFPDADVLAALDALGVRHVVLHLPPRPPPRLARLGLEPGVPLEREYAKGDTLVLAIRRGESSPRPAALPGAPLDRRGWRVSASAGTPSPEAAVDNDPATSWSSWGELERELTTRWYDATPFRARWQRFVESQPARLEVDLGAAVLVSAVALRLGGSDPFAAASLVVETSEDGARWTPLAAEPRPVPDVWALVTHAVEARYALIPDVPVRARFLRLAVSGFEWRVGDLQVHAQ